MPVLPLPCFNPKAAGAVLHLEYPPLELRGRSYGGLPCKQESRLESAADLCHECLDDVAMDVLYMTGNDHAIEEADPLELAEIKRRWKPYIDQLPEYAYLCDELLSRRK